MTNYESQKALRRLNSICDVHGFFIEGVPAWRQGRRLYITLSDREIDYCEIIINGGTMTNRFVQIKLKAEGFSSDWNDTPADASADFDKYFLAVGRANRLMQALEGFDFTALPDEE